MKKYFSIWSVAILLVICLGFSSCSVRTFTTTEMKSNYNLNMTSRSDRALLERVQIFTSESEIAQPFEVISFNRFQPFVLPWPLGNRDRRLTQRLYQQAVRSAARQNGNGVIIINETHFRVIRIQEGGTQ